MEAFTNAHHFYVQNLYAGDNMQYPSTRNDESDATVLDRLQKAACLAAGHQSAERFDPPKCHPETRAAVLNDIMGWVNEPEPQKRLMWLNAPAGGGKSSIAQTIAERCYEENKLLSSFFFSRTATTSGRDDGTRLIPTIAYHLAIAIPEAKSIIIAELRHNPAVLSCSIGTQMSSLVVNPLEQAIVAQIITSGMSCTPQLVIIDGLDECKEPEIQSMILKVIGGIVAQPSNYLRFLVASRPEWEIRKTLNLPTLTGKYHPLTLDDSYEPDKDVEIYLRSEFTAMTRTHPLGEYLSNWPSQSDLNALVRKSSGQFIYASTVIKYITKDRENPRDMLKNILNLSVGEEPNESESPYAQLDALYLHILFTAAAALKNGYNSISPIFEVLLYCEDVNREYILSNESNKHSVQKLADFLGISCFRLQLSLVDLHSILYIPSSNSSGLEIRFYHASFEDFMKDPSRSKIFFIPEDKAHISLGHHCFAILSDPKLPATWKMCSDVQKYANLYYFPHLNGSNFDNELLNEIRSRNIKSFLDRIFSRVRVSEELVYILVHLVNYQISADDSGCIEILPISEKLRDILDDILEVFDDSKGYSLPEIFELIGWISAVRRDPKNCRTSGTELYAALRMACIEDPMRGKRKNVFMCDETCRDLFQDLCRNMTTVGFLDGWDWDWIDVMKYLLGKIEPSYHFGIFLQGELPIIRSFLVDEPLRSRGGIGWFALENIQLDLKKTILMEFKEDVYSYLKKCNIPIHEEIEFLSAVIAFDEAIKSLLS